MIGILDLGMGNLRSVSNAVYSLGYDFRIVRAAGEFDGVSHLIIPGVGAYATATKNLDALSVRGAVRGFAASGRPALGICLGMELLSDSGVEGGASEGLGLIPGEVLRMKPEPALALPHVGWNNIRLTAEHPVFEKVKSGVDFYFVHSYRYLCKESGDSWGETDYGGTFTSIVGRGNVLGFQFHPEKSQANGLRLLDNFCAWDGKC